MMRQHLVLLAIRVAEIQGAHAESSAAALPTTISSVVSDIPIGGATMKYCIRSVIFAACLLANSAWANTGAWLTGDELLQSCKDKEDNYKQGLCMGYILGAADGTTIWELWQDLSSNICVSKKVEMGKWWMR